MNVDTVTAQEARLPFAAHPGDAGHDLFAASPVTIPAGRTVLVPTGVSIALPDGYVAMVCSRSGLALKSQVVVANAPGIVDAGYRGEVGVILHNQSDTTFTVNTGDKIAQLVVTPYVRVQFNPVDTLDDTVRGQRGFGSSDVSDPTVSDQSAAAALLAGAN
ncbi:dUTP diphosphatase [Jonesiaceae bacterium BS-20]|uniref:dUTP diphosphatase n=1 Tax=Jonesiaceae bacterium BS-20 TaxID=3120821 RepID=A0AAU7E1M6_9MICO